MIHRKFNFEAKADHNDIGKLLIKFEELCKPVVDLAYHNFVSGTRDQKPGEGLHKWLTELRTLVRNCEYGLLEKRMLKGRFVLGIKDKESSKPVNQRQPRFP